MDREDGLRRGVKGGARPRCWYIPTVAILVAFLALSGCAAVQEFEETKVSPRIDQVVDATYARLCDLRYKTEQRFLARQQIDGTTLRAFCKRAAVVQTVPLPQ